MSKFKDGGQSRSTKEYDSATGRSTRRSVRSRLSSDSRGGRVRYQQVIECEWRRLGIDAEELTERRLRVQVYE